MRPPRRPRALAAAAIGAVALVGGAIVVGRANTGQPDPRVVLVASVAAAPSLTPIATAPPPSASVTAVAPPSASDTAAPSPSASIATAPPLLVPSAPIRRKGPPPVESTRGTPAIGTLAFRVRPWAEIFVDGKSIGVSPVSPVDLPAGRHSVLLRNKDLNKARALTASISRGETTTVRVDLLE